MVANIFISYRRGDSPAAAGRVYDRLEATYPNGELFMDVDGIEPGLDFVEVLNSRVATCDVLLAIIGRGWLDAADAAGRRRLTQENDFVRIEIEAALERNIRVIPVLVDGVEPPAADALPPGLAPLARRQAVRISHERFTSDMDVLIKSLLRIVPPSGAAAGAGPLPMPQPASPSPAQVQPAALIPPPPSAGDRAARVLDGMAVKLMAREVGSATDYYVAPDIPAHKLANASGLIGPDAGEVLVLLDCTVFGSAKNYSLLTTKGWHHRNPGSAPEQFFVPVSVLQESQLKRINSQRDHLGDKNAAYSGADVGGIEKWRALFTKVLDYARALP